jgi:putative addiction module CopG family antidote
MNVELPPDLERYVDSLVQSGGYKGNSDVIQEALRQHRVSRPGFEVVMTPRLERLLDEGMEDLDEARTTEELRSRQ